MAVVLAALGFVNVGEVAGFGQSDSCHELLRGREILTAIAGSSVDVPGGNALLRRSVIGYWRNLPPRLQRLREQVHYQP